LAFGDYFSVKPAARSSPALAPFKRVSLQRRGEMTYIEVRCPECANYETVTIDSTRVIDSSIQGETLIEEMQNPHQIELPVMVRVTYKGFAVETYLDGEDNVTCSECGNVYHLSESFLFGL
jgi:ribosomal protein S27E